MGGSVRKALLAGKVEVYEMMRKVCGAWCVMCFEDGVMVYVLYIALMGTFSIH